MKRLSGIAAELIKAQLSGRCFARVRQKSLSTLERLLCLLFPQFAEEQNREIPAIVAELTAVSEALEELVGFFGSQDPEACQSLVGEFVDRLPSLAWRLEKDAQAIFLGDPAAQSVDEVIVTYPGFYAISVYRIAHDLYRAQVPILPRLLTEHAHGKTGIDIHPGATIGESFCIDHGTGIVIGETAVIGDHVKIYQGVTLGALSVEKSLAQERRHPTIEDHVTLYSNATILGGKTVIGRNSIIGGNVWLTESVPPNSIVTQASDVRVRRQRAIARGDNQGDSVLPSDGKAEEKR